jgi:hypothetical protein
MQYPRSSVASFTLCHAELCALMHGFRTCAENNFSLRQHGALRFHLPGEKEHTKGTIRI